VNGVDPWGLDALDTAANIAAGWGDALTFGATKRARKWAGEALGIGDANLAVNYRSRAYLGGQVLGTAHGLLLTHQGAARGVLWLRARTVVRTRSLVVQHLPVWVTAAADSKGYILIGRALNAGEKFRPGVITPSQCYPAVHASIDLKFVATLARLRAGSGQARIAVTDLNRLVGEGKILLGTRMRELRILNKHIPEIQRFLR
jgi:hypothetical protein